MKVGDVVILRKRHYKFAPEIEQAVSSRWASTDLLGVITYNRGFVDGTAEYKVYTVDNKHLWAHRDDLLIPE